jgi:hypothetical protein
MNSMMWRVCAISAILLIATLLNPSAPAGSLPGDDVQTTVPSFPLRVSANHRYLTDQSGIPFLIVGDSPQGLISRLSEKEAEEYFADREAHGFNTLGWMNVLCAGSDYPTNILATTPDGIRPFTRFLFGGSDYRYYDLRQPNEAYFVRLDHLIQLATNHHLAVFLDPIETIGWLPTLRKNGLDASFVYGEFLGRRYRRFKNVLWLNGNDFGSWHSGQSGALSNAAQKGLRPLYDAWRERNDDALVQAVAKGIRSASPLQLQTLELEPPNSSSLDNSAWTTLIDLNGTYTYAPTYFEVQHSYSQMPIAPTFLVEAHYEYENIGEPRDFGNPLVLRKQAYWTMLSGGTGQFYGSRYTWSFRKGWQENIDTVGVKQIEHWKKFFTSIAWQDLIPDKDEHILASGASSPGNINLRISEAEYATAAMTSDGSTTVIYVPSVRPISVNMTALNGPARPVWFDPACGSYLPRKPIPNKGVQQFIPPGNNCAGDGDWVLLLTTM